MSFMHSAALRLPLDRDPAPSTDDRLTPAEYEAWLLPPESRVGIERMVHGLSLAAGVIALTTGVSVLWLIF